jgi:hypothetical protein
MTTTTINGRVARFAVTALVSGTLAIGAVVGSGSAWAVPGPGICQRAHTVEGGACGAPTPDGARVYDEPSGPAGGLGAAASEAAHDPSSAGGRTAGDAIS